MRVFYIVFGLLTICFSANSQQLFINEISQGTGAKEYVEFVVTGNATCITPVPTIDLRAVVLDDNNGDFQAGSGTGIATGALRFANTAFWSAIPQGTLILIYNESDINPAIPPNDLSMADGNCRLVIPANSVLLEGQAISPTSSVNTYPAAVSWVAGAGAWSQVAMSNTNDSFQIRQNISSASALHSVSWGNNTLNNQIYFASATGAVFSMLNSSSNNPLTQTNWFAGAVGSNETPGAANNAANDAWIGSMNPQCGVSNAIQLTLNSTPTGCGPICLGTASVSITGGTAPYVILWSNGANTSTISNLCVGTYTVAVSDAGGCSFSDQVTVINAASSLSVQLNATPETCAGACDGAITSVVSGGVGALTYLWSNAATTTSISNLCPNSYSLQVSDQAGCVGSANSTVIAGAATPNATITAAGPFTTDSSPINLQAASLGGTWSSDCGACLNSATGVFNPQIAGAGNFQICYSTGSGACVANDCVTILVTQGCVTIENSSTVSLCPDSTINFNGTLLSNAGSYAITSLAQNGCDSIFTLNLSYFPQTVSEVTQYLCLGDSVQIDGSWISQADIIYNSLLDINGCPYTKQTTVLTEDCTIEDLTVFVPNVFTPNNDGTNDTFNIFITGGNLTEGFILNRWGNIITEFSAEDLSWDGKGKEGSLVQDGVYTYVLVVKKNENDFVERVVGFVTVLR